MTTINLTTIVKAPIQKVFDINRNIDIHQNSASGTNEKAIAGVTSGLINLNETVTWRGKHFGFYLTHKSRMTAMNMTILLTKWKKVNLNLSNTNIFSVSKTELQQWKTSCVMKHLFGFLGNYSMSCF